MPTWGSSARSATACVGLFSLVGACGGPEQIKIELPPELDSVAVFRVKDARAPLDPGNLIEATGIIPADELARVEDGDVIIAGWSLEALQPVRPPDADVIENVPVRLRGPSELIEALPVPSWQRAVSADQGSVEAVSVPELTADWLPTLPSWSRIGAPTSPPPRYRADLVADPMRDRLVLFGGFAEPRINPRDDTWIFDGDWTELQIDPRPEARGDSGLARDPISRDFILFGGKGIDARLADTWRFDGSAWSELSLAPSPGAREGHRMCLDPSRGRIVLFGGLTASGVLDDTWIFDGLAWTRLASTVSPPARYQHSMFFHEGRQTVIVLGGRNAVEALDDAWELVDDTWRPIPEMELPERRSGFVVSYVPSRDWVVMHGGSDEVAVRHEGTRVFDGAWRLLEERTSSPSPRNLQSMAYWSSHDSLVMFGGILYGVFEDQTLDETYRLDLAP